MVNKIIQAYHKISEKFNHMKEECMEYVDQGKYVLARRFLQRRQHSSREMEDEKDLTRWPVGSIPSSGSSMCQGPVVSGNTGAAARNQ